MADLSQILAVRLRQIRHERAWTQEELADRVGLSVRYIGQIERCQASPTVSVLGRLADALHVEPGELLRRVARRKAGK
jgi:transcriptional regulator with XRE-family HTH domain